MKETKFRALARNHTTDELCFVYIEVNMRFTGHEKIVGPWEQFIGLPDKNKIDIYEGDICKVTDPNGGRAEDCIVEFDPSGYIYGPEGGYGDFDLSSIGWAMDMGYNFEIIGNIHEEASE